MNIEAIKVVVDLIEMGGVVGQEDIVKCLRSAIEQAERQEPVAYTQGHCKEKAKPGGCQLHNLHCGYPACDRKPVTAPPQRQPLNLNNYLNDADISAADTPHKVVQKLQAAIDRAHGIGGEHD